VRACIRAGIPAVLIDANLHPGSRRLWPVGRTFYRVVLSQFRAILAVSEDDAGRFRRLCGPGTEIVAVGDTRFDRVWARSREYPPATHDVFSPSEGPILVLGSTWPSDDVHLLPVMARLLDERPALRVIWVPHEPEAAHLAALERALGRSGITGIRGSAHTRGNRERVVIVDRVGILAHVYGGATVAYVGGSFGPGVHNVMEPRTTATRTKRRSSCGAAAALPCIRRTNCTKVSGAGWTMQRRVHGRGTPPTLRWWPISEQPNALCMRWKGWPSFDPLSKDHPVRDEHPVQRRHDQITRRPHYMRDETWHKIIDESRSRGIIYRPFLVNEPLTDKRLPAIIRYIKEDSTATVELNSNGGLLTEWWAEELIDSGLDVMRFSVDGFSQATYERTGRGDNYDRIEY
jgi:hypothetical protein